jgi:hypothetical protein
MPLPNLVFDTQSHKQTVRQYVKFGGVSSWIYCIRHELVTS